MGILARFKSIMAANINAWLDKCEDPEKMIDQYLREMESDLGKVKAETAAVMAEATRAKRELDQCDEEINKLQSYAEKALKAGNEEDAKKFLAQKIQMQNTRNTLAAASEVATRNADQMRQMHDKLTKDINELNDRKASIKAKVAAAKAQEKINDLTEKVGSMTFTDGTAAFDRMEAKADQMLDQANARAELNAGNSETQSIAELKEKYDKECNTDVDAELAALKESLGMTDAPKEE